MSTTYNNTPFSITFVPGTLNGNAVNPGTVTITGVLNGTVTGSNHSSVVATFNPLAIDPVQFELGQARQAR